MPRCQHAVAYHDSSPAVIVTNSLPNDWRTSMIRLLMCLHRRPDITREEFQDYWQNKHGPFFQENVGTMRSKRYVQSHIIDSPLNEGIRASRGMQPE